MLKGATASHTAGSYIQHARRGAGPVRAILEAAFGARPPPSRQRQARDAPWSCGNQPAHHSMIDRRSVPALHRACLHQRNQPGGKEPGGFLCPDSLKTDMTMRLAARRGPRLRSPRLDRLVGKPNSQAASPLQCRVVLCPVRDPIPRLGNVVTVFSVVFERHSRADPGRGMGFAMCVDTRPPATWNGSMQHSHASPWSGHDLR
jgi:hypothetical protein